MSVFSQIQLKYGRKCGPLASHLGSENRIRLETPKSSPTNAKSQRLTPSVKEINSNAQIKVGPDNSCYKPKTNPLLVTYELIKL